MPRRVKIIISLLMLIVSTLSGLFLAHIKTLPPAATPGLYTVVKVYDGDTIEITMNGTPEKVRFIGVDTPETHKPNTPVQCFGPQASDYTTKTLSGASVRLQADPLGDNRDRYGRLLRYVYLQDDTLLDKDLIARGYGFAYVSFAFQKKAEFAKAQDEARAAKRGLWALCSPTKMGERWQSNAL